jgi:hypothetical protein
MIHIHLLNDSSTTPLLLSSPAPEDPIIAVIALEWICNDKESNTVASGRLGYLNRTPLNSMIGLADDGPSDSANEILESNSAKL